MRSSNPANTHSLPNLQKLALWKDEVNGAIHTIHAETLASLAPSLKGLSLSQFILFWTAADDGCTFPHLRDLAIRCKASPESTQDLDIKVLLEHNDLPRLLKNMPQLEELDLEDAVPFMRINNKQEDTPFGPPISLPPNLAAIALGANSCPYHCIQLLSEVAIACPRARLALFLRHGIIPPERFAFALEALFGPRRPPKTLCLRLSMRCSNILTVTVKGSSADGDVTGYTAVSQDYRADDGAHISGMCVAELETLDVQAGFEEGYIDVERVLFPKTEWLGLFRSARNVRKVCVKDALSALALFEALIEGLEGKETPSSGHGIGS
ncbi:hypothetical protein OF83DRAFT_1180909 [Amylostereum chailletii]|nr:hypothetical protein OF83DRAFT_1180909 [Amylostereum chailletii]